MTVVLPWRSFSAEQVSRLAETRQAADMPDGWRCPNCRGSIRHYCYESRRRAVQTLISYVWCPTCKHYYGSTGPLPPGLEVDDPLRNLAPDERLRLESNLASFLHRLDDLWDADLLSKDLPH